MDLSLFFAGTGGSVPTARRGLPAVLLRRGGDKLLFDCGEGTQRQLLRTVGLPEVSDVFLTHFHLDHWLGLPGMLKSFELRDREAPLTLHGPPGTRDLMGLVRQITGRLRYGFHIDELEAGDEVHFDGYAVHALSVRHRQNTAFGYAIEEDDRPGRFDADRARDLGVPFGPAFGALQRGETVGGVTPDMVIGPARAGRKVVLSGDTSPCDMVRVAAHEADVLVHEATFLDSELERAMETGHSTARQAAEVAAEAGVRMLCLTHVSTRYFPREIRDEARAVFPGAVVPRDFDTVEIPQPEKGEPELVRWSDGDVPVPAEAAPQ